MSDRLRSIIADLLLAIFAFLAAVILLIGASDLPPPRFEPLGSAALPRILAVIIIFFSLLIALRAYLKNQYLRVVGKLMLNAPGALFYSAHCICMMFRFPFLKRRQCLLSL